MGASITIAHTLCRDATRRDRYFVSGRTKHGELFYYFLPLVRVQGLGKDGGVWGNLGFFFTLLFSRGVGVGLFHQAAAHGFPSIVSAFYSPQSEMCLYWSAAGRLLTTCALMLQGLETVQRSIIFWVQMWFFSFLFFPRRRVWLGARRGIYMMHTVTVR